MKLTNITPYINEGKSFIKLNMGGANAIELKEIDGYEGEGVSIVQKSKTGNTINTIVVPKEFVKDLIYSLGKIEFNKLKTK